MRFPAAITIFLTLGLGLAQQAASDDLEKGDQFYSRYDFASAARSLERALQKDPGNLRARILLANSLWEIHDYPRALDAYQKVLSHDPATVPQLQRRIATDRIGMVYGMSGQLDKAESWYKNAIAADPTYPHYYYNLACSYAEKNDLKNTLANLELALQHRNSASADDTLPNPATDDSFQKYLHNPQFAALLAKFNGPVPRPDPPQKGGLCAAIAKEIGTPPASRAERVALFEKARARAHQAGDLQCEVFLLMSLAKLSWALGDKPDAFEFYHQAAEFAEKNKLYDAAALALQSFGDLHRQNGNYSVAADAYAHATDLVRRTKTPMSDAIQVRLLNAQGLLAQAMNDLAGALKFMSDALTLARQIDDSNEIPWILNDIGGVYSQSGDFVLALSQFQRAVEASKESSDPSVQPGTWNNVGFAYRQLGMFDQARVAFEKADSLIPQALDPILPGRIKNNLAELYAATGRMDDAGRRYLEAYKLKTQAGDLSGAAMTVANLGAVLLHQGNPAQAYEFVKAALDDAEQRGDTFQSALFWDSLGVIREEQKDPAGALEAYLKSIAYRDRMRTAAQLSDLRKAQSVLSSDAYERAVYLYARQGKIAEAFNLSERARSRTFVEVLADPRVKWKPAGADSKLVNEEHDLRTSISELEDHLRNLPKDSPDRRAVLDQRVALERTYQDVVERLKASDPQYGALTGASPATLADVQSDVPPDAALLSLFVTTSGVVAFIVKHDTAGMQLLNASKADLTRAVNGYRRFSTRDIVPEGLTALFNALILPIQSKLNTPKLYIEPHDITQQISFAALTPDGEKWFGADRAISYLPAASVLHVLKGRKASRARVPMTAFAQSNPPGIEEPLLSADAEADTVAGLYGVKAVHGTTEADFLAQAPGSGIIHVAAHASLNGAQPSLSAIIFAPAKDQDGLLHVNEVANLDLSSASLVVLAACDTGFGPAAAGDEISSLHRSFLIAGASSVVATLWKVDDNISAMFMESFYTSLKSGKTPAEALQLTQQSLRTDYPHPFYWAGFTLTGDAGWR
jgi:CHAT domain-containing protein/tetratricopeptide (TPR) repeat protein